MADIESKSTLKRLKEAVIIELKRTASGILVFIAVASVAVGINELVKQEGNNSEDKDIPQTEQTDIDVLTGAKMAGGEDIKTLDSKELSKQYFIEKGVKNISSAFIYSWKNGKPSEYEIYAPVGDNLKGDLSFINDKISEETNIFRIYVLNGKYDLTALDDEYLGGDLSLINKEFKDRKNIWKVWPNSAGNGYASQTKSTAPTNFRKEKEDGSLN